MNLIPLDAIKAHSVSWVVFFRLYEVVGELYTGSEVSTVKIEEVRASCCGQLVLVDRVFQVIHFHATIDNDLLEFVQQGRQTMFPRLVGGGGVYRIWSSVVGGGDLVAISTSSISLVQPYLVRSESLLTIFK